MSMTAPMLVNLVVDENKGFWSAGYASCFSLVGG
jgi:hypothetical protein